MLTLKLSGGDCKIIVREGILAQIGVELLTLGLDECAIIADENAAKFHIERLKTSLNTAGITHFSIIIPSGEASKSITRLAQVYSDMAARGASRKTAIVALGGGVCGDLAGFAASTYMRGVPIVQIPTTLLAQVDSSVGGKCGIDISEGKNLVGAFKQPKAVFIDPELLNTLPGQNFCDGMAEVIKYGCLFSRKLFDDVKTGFPYRPWSDIIHECVEYKADLVQKDEFDRSLRTLLNFGHTIGHAIEKLGGFSAYSHGQAVGIGMLYAARIGERLGLTAPDCQVQICQALQAYQLPVKVNFYSDNIYTALTSDKKAARGYIDFVFISQIGESFIENLPLSDLKALLKAVS